MSIWEEPAEENAATYYVVRGAKMRCYYGTHTRRINLPESHGTYVGDKPMMSEDDYKEKNISHFGICSSPENTSGETIYLIEEQKEGAKGEPRQIEGKPCKPNIFAPWQDTHQQMKVDGRPALTSKSWLVCGGCRGSIYFVTTGQEEG